ncbi:hypothetical protein ACJJTC_000645 [Scirpophaga incertulas]
MPDYDDTTRLYRFTRGEKCLFIHLMVTFFFILVLAIIYAVHLLTVNHNGDLKCKTDYSTEGNGSVTVESWLRTGMVVILDSRTVCGCLLIRRWWSLAPAHCVAPRSASTLAHLLPLWRLRYSFNGITDLKVTQSTVHPAFSFSDFRNNVGLFKHADSLMFDDYQISPIAVNDNMLYEHAGNLSLVIWQQFSMEMNEQDGGLTRVQLSPLSAKTCRQIARPVVDLRSYEFCSVLPRTTRYGLNHGAAFMVNSEIKGFFSWGDKQGEFPLIMLDIAHFSDWIESVTL